MKTKTPTLLAAAAFAAAFPASAETTEATKQGVAEEVVALDETVVEGQTLYSDQVSALKTPTPILDVPQSLSITTAEDISLRGFDSIEDIVAYTPGVNISQGEGHRDAVVFRGVRSTADFYVDGVRDDVQYYRPLYNIEQVEILRGPNALLFGRGGAGGILNRVTKKAEIGEDFNGYSASIDTFGAYELQIDSNISINDDTAFRLNAYYDEFENHRDFSDGDGYGINPTFKFQLGEKTTLDVSYERIDYDRFIDRGIPSDGNGSPADEFDGVFFGDPDLNESEFEADVFRALLQHQFSDTLKGNLTASYGDYDKSYQNIFPSRAINDGSDSPDPITGSGDFVEVDGYIDTTERQNFVLSGNLIGEFETGDIKHTVLFGAEYIDSDSENDRFNANFSGDNLASSSDQALVPVSDPVLKGGVGVNANGDPISVDFTTNLNDDTQTDLEVYSFYIQDEIQLTEELIFVLGARFDSFDIDVSGTDNGSQKDEEVTPRVGIIYKPQNNISLYASYSETFLPASGEQFANLGDQGLEPDEFSNLEAGVKWDFAQGYSVTAAIFEIEQDLNEEVGDVSVNTENEIQGFEAQFQGRITDQWYITAGYSYLTGELDDSDNDPRELPEHTFSIWNHYQVTEKLGLGLGAIYQDESFANDDNEVVLPDFIRVDAAAYYQINDDLRLQVNIENLLDQEYFPSAHTNNNITVGAPINARFAIIGRF